MIVQQYTQEMSENKIDFILCPNTFEETPKTIEELIGKNEA